MDLPPITIFGNIHAQKLKLRWLSKRRYFTCLEYSGTFLLNFLRTAMGPSGAGTLRAGGHLQCWHSDPPFYLHLNPPPTNHPPLHLWWPQHVKPPIVPTSLEVPVIQHVRRWREGGALMIFLRSSAIAIFPNIIFMMLSFRLLL